MELTEKNLGQWFKVPNSPNPHMMVKFEPHHCDLHGEFLFNQAGLIKRRNSENRRWGGSIKMMRADQNKVVPWTGDRPEGHYSEFFQ